MFTVKQKHSQKAVAVPLSSLDWGDHFVVVDENYDSNDDDFELFLITDEDAIVCILSGAQVPREAFPKNVFPVDIKGTWKFRKK